MNRNAIQKIAKHIYRQFPEVSGAEPRVTPKAQAKSISEPTYLLTFSGTGKNPAGKAISRTVRVTASADGKILKVSTSR